MEKNKYIEKTVIIILYLVSAVFLGLTIASALNNSIWVDEAFSINLIKNSYKEVVELTAQDVHPPLYYIILKMIVDISFNCCDNIIIVSKLLSVVPIIIILIYSIVVLRKKRGELCAAIFSMCITAMPQIMGYAIEIRMYSWAMLFVFFSGIYAYKIMKNEQESDHKLWILFTVYSILSAYTHYFALVSVGIIYILLFVKLIITNKRKVKYWLLSVLGITIVYLPWLIILLKQMSAISGNYWIEPIKLETIKQYIEFIFIGNFNSQKSLIVGYMLLFVYLIILITSIKNSKNKIADSIGACVLFFTAVVGIIISLIFRPIFIERYLIPTFGLFWLSFSDWLSNKRKMILIPVLVLMIIVGMLYGKYVIKREMQIGQEYNKYASLIEEIPEEDIIIYTQGHLQTSTSIYREKNNYLWKGEFSELVNKIFPNLETISRKEEIYKYLEEKKKIWIFGNSSDTLKKMGIENDQIEVKEYGKYKLEFYNMYVYKIEYK